MVNTIEETIKHAGLGKKGTMKKQIDLYEKKISDQGEKLIAVCASKKGLQQLYVTDHKVILNEIKGMTSNNEVSIPISSINSINVETKLVYSVIEVISSGNAAVIHDVPVHIANEIKRVIEDLKLNSSKREVKEPSISNVPDELKKFKELADQGVITQEEFDAKKKQLLGI